MGQILGIWKRTILHKTYEKSYRIYWFNKDSYRTYYSPEGELEEVIIIYPYKVKSSKGFAGVGLNTDKRYMRLKITATEIEEYHAEQEIKFDQESTKFC